MQLINSVQQAAATSAALAAADSSGTPGSTSGSAIKPDALAGTDTFLKLLVAQIKNQNPTQPTDPTQFLSELAQFSQLDQLIAIRQGVQSLAPPSGSGSGSNDGGGSSASAQAANTK